jgi:hypothetical protein
MDVVTAILCLEDVWPLVHAFHQQNCTCRGSSTTSQYTRFFPCGKFLCSIAMFYRINRRSNAKKAQGGTAKAYSVPVRLKSEKEKVS